MRNRRILRAVALAALSLLGLGAAHAAGPPPRSYAGLTLAEALADLQARGLRIVYSDDLVRPEMRVVEEPRAAWLHDVLEELLAPHGLAVRVGPGGSLLVVRGEPAPVRVAFLRPEPGAVAAGEIDVAVAVASDDPIAWVDFFVDGWPAARVRRPPYEARVSVPDAPGACRLAAVATTIAGGRGSAAVTARRVVLEERLDVSLRQVHVAVSGRHGVPALAREDFELLDGGVEQEIAAFGRGEAPLSVLLLVDASESMRGDREEAAFAAARAFVARLGPADEAAVMVFADRLLSLTPFGPPESGLLAAVEATAAAGATALTDHVYAALRLLEGRPGRRVLVLLSDGADVLSSLTAEDLLWKVRRTDVTLYWLRLGQRSNGLRFSSAWRDPAGNDREAAGLVAAVAASGGRVDDLPKAGDLPASLGRLLDELRQQYVLGYYPEGARGDGRWHPVEVRVRVPGVRLRYRDGWVDRP